MRDCSWVPTKFENIRHGNFNCTSDRTDHLPDGGYNCIAWAAGDTRKWWWPVDDPGAYWPDGLDKEPLNQETLSNFIKAFQSLGYKKCLTPRYEKGVEKIAIFVGSINTPTHAARSLP